MSNRHENIPVQDEEALVIDLGAFGSALKRNFRVILAGTLVGLIGAGAFAGLFYQEEYRSEATLLFSPTELSSVVSQFNVSNRLSQNDYHDINRFKNQEQLLKSRQLAERVLAGLVEANIPLDQKTPEYLLKKVLDAGHVTNTDFIRISAKAGSPRQAQQIAQVYQDTYLNWLEELAYKPLTEQHESLKLQVEKSGREIKELAQAIHDYQAHHGIVNINEESQLRVAQLERLNAEVKAVEASLGEKKAEIAEMRSQLNMQDMDLSSVLKAVATGQDDQMFRLQSDLQDAERDYATKGMIYAPTNPEMKQLEEKIQLLRRQATELRIMNVGQAEPSSAGVIKDAVRRDMVNRLAQREADRAALTNRLGTLQSQAKSLRASLQGLPSQKLEYARLMNELKSKQEIHTRMREKLAEVQIQESAVRKSLTPIDQPDLPVKPASLPKWQLVLLAGVLGCGLSIAGVLGSTLSRSQGVRPYFMENVARIPVLSVIPWVSNAAWNRCRNRNTLEVLMSPVDADVLKAYQDFALNLRACRDAEDKNALTVASVYSNPEQSIILSNLAYCLAQSGERVILVDTNLRTPRLHDMFGHSLDYDRGLTELINSLSEYRFHKPDADPSTMIPMVESSLLPSGIHSQLHYINAGVGLENTFEFLNSKGFALLVQVLKAHYDWVLFDAPPFLTSPDAAVELGYMDGLLLLAENDSTEEQIQLLTKKVRQLNSTIIGCSLRQGDQ